MNFYTQKRNCKPSQLVYKKQKEIKKDHQDRLRLIEELLEVDTDVKNRLLWN